MGLAEAGRRIAAWLLSPPSRITGRGEKPTFGKPTPPGLAAADHSTDPKPVEWVLYWSPFNGRAEFSAPMVPGQVGPVWLAQAFREAIEVVEAMKGEGCYLFESGGLSVLTWLPDGRFMATRVRSDGAERKGGWPPVYHHPDGGRYVIVNRGEMKCPVTGDWLLSVSYRSIDPDAPKTIWTTTEQRWNDRFVPVRHPAGET